MNEFTENPIWEDNFDIDGLPDASRWDYQVGGTGWGNNELQYYTNADIDNVRVNGGVLTIEARKERLFGKNYTSTRLVTHDKLNFLYGRVVVRAKLPAGRGTWPAIWMLSSENKYDPTNIPNNGEIDIMEHVGYDPGQVHSVIHRYNSNKGLVPYPESIIQVPDFNTAFHEYRMDWTPEYIKTFLDGKETLSFENSGKGWQDWPFDQKMYLLLNIAVGGSWGGLKGVDDTIFPAKMEVDYVRIYEYKQR
ncbi:glycoside hydrolase family 16 protein [Aquirufa salirivi]